MKKLVAALLCYLAIGLVFWHVLGLKPLAILIWPVAIVVLAWAAMAVASGAL